MSYYFAKTIEMPFEDAVRYVTKALKAEGFGVLTDIDVKETLKEKLDVEFHDYRILGACNPRYAHRALQTEDKIGVLLPCSVIVQRKARGSVEIAAVDPISAMEVVGNPDLAELGNEVARKLESIIGGL
jgi:uncharacterized protein (DUF302 family)